MSAASEKFGEIVRSPKTQKISNILMQALMFAVLCEFTFTRSMEAFQDDPALRMPELYGLPLLSLLGIVSQYAVIFYERKTPACHFFSSLGFDLASLGVLLTAVSFFNNAAKAEGNAEIGGGFFLLYILISTGKAVKMLLAENQADIEKARSGDRILLNQSTPARFFFHPRIAANVTLVHNLTTIGGVIGLVLSLPSNLDAKFIGHICMGLSAASMVVMIGLNVLDLKDICSPPSADSYASV